MQTDHRPEEVNKPNETTAAQPSEITAPIGNIDLLSRESKTAFLCSRKMPDYCLTSVNTWIDSLSPEEDCIMCGNLQKTEGLVLSSLIKRHIPAILVLDRPYPEMWPTSMVEAIGDGKLLVLTTTDFLLPWIDKYGMAEARNRYMIANAAKVVTGFCRPGGQLQKQLASANAEVTYLNPYDPALDIKPDLSH